MYKSKTSSLVKSSLIILSALLAALAFNPQALANAEKSCFANFVAAQGTLEHLNQQQRQKRSSPEYGQIPRFMNPAEEIARSAQWRGEAGPHWIQEFLPEGVSFISHQLRDAKGEGVVKDPGSGEFVMLRVTMAWRGQEVGVNVSVPASFLAANLTRKEKWLVGPEAAAVADWGHGGGTKTTGNHTSVGLMGHLFRYGVAVIALDQPWHGEGPRNYFQDANDYFAFRKAFLKKYIHPNVPVIGTGHSMGGLFADMMMRRSDDPELGLNEVYKGFVSLSGVADQRPGQSFREKSWAEQVHDAEQKWPEVMERIAPGDLNLGEQLIRQDKISPLSMMFVQFMNLFHDWSLPKGHQGEQYTPALYIWGEADYLFVGNEKLFKDYLLPLKNVELKTFTPRIDFKGRVNMVGHLIFDHGVTEENPAAAAAIASFMKRQDSALENFNDAQLVETFYKKHLQTRYSEFARNNPSNMTSEAFLAAGYLWVPGFKEHIREIAQRADRTGKSATMDPEQLERNWLKQFNHHDRPETYTLVRQFIEERIGKKLEIRRNQSELIGMTRMFQAYANILTFREFVDRVEIRNLKQSQKINELNNRASSLIRNLKTADKILRNMNLSEEQKRAEVAKLDWPKDDAGHVMSIEVARLEMMTLDQIRAREFVPEGPMAEAAKANIAERNQLQVDIKSLVAQKDHMKADLEAKSIILHRLYKHFDELLASSESPQLAQLRDITENTLMDLLKEDEKVRNQIDGFIGDLHERGDLTPASQSQVPPDMVKAFEQYEAHSKIYQDQINDLYRKSQQLAVAGELGPELKEVATRLFGADLNGGLEIEFTTEAHALNHLEGKIYAAKMREQDLVEEYVEKIMPGYFTVERVKVRDLLDRADDWKNSRGLLEKAWSQWLTLWRERPPADSVELY